MDKAMKNIFSRILNFILITAMISSMLIIPSHAINDVMELPIKAGCYMTLETNKHSMEYMQGDEVELTVRLFDAEGNRISAPYIRYNLRIDGSNEAGYGEYQLHWTTVPFRDGEYTIKTTATAGFMRLRVDILDENKAVINRKYTGEGDWTEFGPKDQLSFFQGGVVVDAENIRTTAAEKSGEQVGSLESVTYDEYGVPSDFMDFWTGALSELDGEENRPRLIELSEISSSFGDWYKKNHDIYAFKVSCPGDETDLKSGDTYVTGTIQIPKTADPQSAGIEVWYCGYGITKPGAQGSDANAGKIVITVAAHSLDYDFEGDANPTSDAFNLCADQQGETNYYGFSFAENQDRDDVYFKYMLLRDIQAIRFMTQTFKAGGEVAFDASADEATKTLAETVLTPKIGIWDGEHIDTNGASQGGFQAVAVAALYSETLGEREQGITGLYASIPWMCDVQGNTDITKVQSTYRQHYSSAQSGVEGEAVGLNYYDTVNFGRFVQCDTVISAGMGDPLCPASGVTALYNNIRTNGQDINVTLGFTQGRTHGTNDNSAKHPEEKLCSYSTNAGLDSILTYTDENGNFKAGIRDGVLYISSLGDEKILESTADDAFVTYVEQHKTALKTVKIIGRFAEIGDTFYIFRNLDSVTALQIDYRTDTVGVCSVSDGHGNFYSMNGLKTMGHVEFDINGNVVESSRNNIYTENVVDLRGFKNVINHTGNSNYDALPHDMLRGVGATKVIMPETLMCGGVDVAGVLPIRFLANVYSKLEVIIPARVSVMGAGFIWNSPSTKTLRFEGGVTSDFTIGGTYIADNNNSTIAGITGASVYLLTQADVDTVQAALTATGIPSDKLNAVLSEPNVSYTISDGVLSIAHGGDSGIARCDAAWLTKMSGVTEIYIENGYTYLGAGIFDMSDVVTVYIPDSVTEISPDCFSGVTDFTIIATPGSYAETFAKENGINFDVIATKDNILTSGGILAKIAVNDSIGDAVAIRFLFNWNERGTRKVGNPIKVGVVACAESYYNSGSVAGDNEAEKLEALLGDKTGRVLQNDVAVYENGELDLRGKFLADSTNAAKGKYGYSYTLYGITPEHYGDEIYAATYIQWDDGTYTVVSNSYAAHNNPEKTTISLYDVTLGLFKKGLINSEKVENRYLWDVITLGGQTAAEKTSNNLNIAGYCFADNISGGFVYAYRALDKTKESYIDSPYNTVNWFKSANKNSIKVIVADHGVTAMSGSARIFGTGSGVNTSVTAIVYPSGFNFDNKGSSGTHAFCGLSALENVIWCHTDADGKYVEHMSDIQWNEGVTDTSSLVDLRGYAKFPKSNNLFENCTSVKNVILNKNNGDFNAPNSTAVVWRES